MISKSYLQTRIRKFIAGITGIMFLFYMISCGSADISFPSSNAVSLITSLTLKEVREDSITLDWDLFKIKEGVVDPTMTYTVHAEAHAGEGAFTNVPDTETVYTIGSSVDLGEGRSSTVLPVIGMRAAGIKVAGLANDTPYRIVVEAKSASGNTSQAHVLAYTASLLVDPSISGLGANNFIDSGQVVVTWEPKEGAQFYLIQASEEGNQLEETVSIDNILMVVCPPGSLLCEKQDQFAYEGDGELEYLFQVNKKAGRYKLVIVPFNFHDLQGLQAVDEEGRVRTFTEEVLTQVENVDSVLSKRLRDTLKDPAKVKEIQIKVSIAEAPTDLVLDSTGSTLSASWGHGIGAEYYYATLIGEEVTITHIIDRYEASGKFAGRGYTSFDNLKPETPYTVLVQSLTVINNVTNEGGYVLAEQFTKDAGDKLNPPNRVTGDDLTLINSEAGELRIAWNTPEENSVVGYNVFYWAGEDAPDKPQYVVGKGETDLTFAVPPGSYRVRIDVISSYTEEVVTGGISSIAIYGKPLSPKGLGVDFTRGSFTNIDNKLYAISYPLTYTEAETPVEAGGPVENVQYRYRYRVAGGSWIGYNEIADEAIVSLQVDDLSDAAVIKNGYGKKYQVEIITDNAGGFSSEVGVFEFIYKSFPEPFIQSTHLEVEPGNRSFTVSWPALDPSAANGSGVYDYTVTIHHDRYALPVQSTNILGQKVVFENLKNNHPYFITVIPNGTDTGSVFNALSAVTGYTVGAVIEKGSQEDTILAAYIGEPDTYQSQGDPEAVVNLRVIALPNQAEVTWDEPAEGSPVSRYVLEYLADVRTPITHIEVSGDDADAELSGLSWDEATSVRINTNDSGSYTRLVRDLNISSTINVFRVKGIYVDTSGKEWSGRYRYYALGLGLARAPGTVGDLIFSDHVENISFKVAWSKPDDPGRDINNAPAQLIGYKVSWGTNAENLEQSYEIDGLNILSYVITGITSGTQYHVKVQAKNNNTGEKNYGLGSIDSVYTIKKPGSVVPSTITYGDHTIRSFKVSWAKVTDAGYTPKGPLALIGYRLELSNQGGWRHIVRSNYLATEETLTDLDPGINYQVRVIATNEFSVHSIPKEGGTTWTLSLSGSVKGMRVSDPDYDEENHTGGFKVSWTAPSDTGITSSGEAATITGYEVAYTEVVNDTPGVYTDVDHEEMTTEYVFTGLKIDAKYDIRIQAKSAAGTGRGTHITGWTPSLPGKVDPSSISFSGPTASSIHIGWKAPEPGRVGGSSSANTPTLYKVEISPQGSSLYTLVRDNYSSTDIIAEGLKSGTSYLARITAKNVHGSALASVSTSVGTTSRQEGTPPSPVYDLWAKKGLTKHDQLVIAWIPPTNTGTTNGTAPASLTGYIVEYKVHEEMSGFAVINKDSVGVRLKEDLTGEDTTATILGLRGDTVYYFRVVAINSANKRSEAQSFDRHWTTFPSPPSGLTQASCNKPTSLQLRWNSPTLYSSVRVTNNLYRDNKIVYSNIIFLTDTDETNYYTDTDVIPGKSYTYKVESCTAFGCSASEALLQLKTPSDTGFASIIHSSNVPGNLSEYDERSREIFSRYSSSSSLVAKYVKEEDNLKTVIDGITASANNVYVVLLSGGTYKPKEAISMKNHVAIVGGVDECMEFSDKVTALDGEGTRQLFYNNANNLDNTALLYGVTITNGKAIKGGGMHNYKSSPSLTRVIFSGNTAIHYGGGMYNDNSFPSLSNVIFSGNTAPDYGGGGMYNLSSSPSLIRVTFSGNSAKLQGGGMYNVNSSPNLVGVTFSGNKGGTGGGMHNSGSSPNLVGVTFSRNTANSYGGGMHNSDSSPNLVGVTFFTNTANSYGGGMYNNNDGEAGPTIINGIFWGNTASSGSQFYLYNKGSAQENLRIYNSVVEGGAGTLESRKTNTSIINNGGGFAFWGEDTIAPTVISFSKIYNIDPQLKELTDNDGGVRTHPIDKNSPAVNKGLFVKRKGTDYYYSANNLANNPDWYTDPGLSSETKATLPSDAIEITAVDATGRTRTDSPDLGAYEARPDLGAHEAR